jgi:hypothetical protein
MAFTRASDGSRSALCREMSFRGRLLGLAVASLEHWVVDGERAQVLGTVVVGGDGALSFVRCWVPVLRDFDWNPWFTALVFSVLSDAWVSGVPSSKCSMPLVRDAARSEHRRRAALSSGSVDGSCPACFISEYSCMKLSIESAMPTTALCCPEPPSMMAVKRQEALTAFVHQSSFIPIFSLGIDWYLPAPCQSA